MKKVVFSFLVDFDYQKSVVQSIPLIKSIRNLGGSLKDSDILLCHVGDIPSEYFDKVSNTKNLKFKKVNQFHKNHKHSNKLRILEQKEIFNYEFLCLLDCDTVVLDDISDSLIYGKIGAKIADGKTINQSLFKKLFDLKNINFPNENFKTTNGLNTIAYCNAGVIIIDTKLTNFIESWINNTRWLCNNIDTLGSSRFFCEQASLSISLYQYGIEKYNELPKEMNFPSHMGLNINKKPKIVHYHDQLSKGKLKTPYTLINNDINIIL